MTILKGNYVKNLFVTLYTMSILRLIGSCTKAKFMLLILL